LIAASDSGIYSKDDVLDFVDQSLEVTGAGLDN
jgi:hypothetical protein